MQVPGNKENRLPDLVVNLPTQGARQVLNLSCLALSQLNRGVEPRRKQEACYVRSSGIVAA